MTILLNSAGVSAADPILKGLGLDVIFFSSSFDRATNNDFGIDQNSSATITNSVKGSVSPSDTVFISGTTGSYTQATTSYNIGTNTGVSVGDWIYLAHGSLTDGIYRIASLVSSDSVTVEGNELTADQSNVSYDLAHTYSTDTGTSPIVSSAGGTENWAKYDVEDAGSNQTEGNDNFFVRDAPAGSSLVAIDGVSYTGQTFSDGTFSLAILSAWANNGGVSHIELVSGDFTWTNGGGTGEVTLAVAEGGLTASAGDGAKSGTLKLKSRSGSATSVDVALSATIDSSGPIMSVTLRGA